MIFDNLRNKDKYKEDKALYRVLCYLADTYRGVETILPEVGTIIEEGISHASPVTLTTQPESDCFFEAHRKYADVHFIVEGVEKIGVSDVTLLTPRGEFNEESDICFYDGEISAMCTLHTGDFLVCYTSDAHMVKIAKDLPADVKKIVVKIREN